MAYLQDDEYHFDKFRLENHCSVYQAELLAIKRAISWCIEVNTSAIIHSDSNSSLQAIQNRSNRNTLAVEIRQLLQSHPEHICLRWVKAHVGIEGNEKADQLAKEATEAEIVQYSTCPSSYAIRLMKHRVDNLWNQRWLDTRKDNFGAVTKYFFPTIADRKKCSFIPDFIMTQYLTGHGRFNAYLKRIDVQTNDECENCGQVETSLHLIEDCPRTAMLKRDLDIEVSELLGLNSVEPRHYCRDDCVATFESFLKRIDRLH